MNHEILDIAQQYKLGKVNAFNAMNTIVDLMLPKEDKDDLYVKKLVAFVLDVDESELGKASTKRAKEFMANCMFTKLILNKYGNNETAVGKLFEVNRSTINYRHKEHKKMYEINKEYTRLFDKITRTLDAL